MSDLRETLKGFDYEPKKGELEDMIWEVDETMDKHISYQEFNLMYRRVCPPLEQGKSIRQITDTSITDKFIKFVYNFELRRFDKPIPMDANHESCSWCVTI